MGHMAAECEGKAKRKNGEFDEKGEIVPKKPYQFLHIWTLREYLELEMRIPNIPFKIDFERIVDDFIFMCFFVGNDFLPHMPTLEIREGAINLLLAVYKKEFRALGGYLTDGSKPNMSRVEHFIQAVGSYEDKIFSKRARLHQRQAERVKRDKVLVKRGDDAEPQIKPDMVPVARFHGSRLASGHAPSPYQHTQSSNQRAPKVARLSSEATIGAALVEAENKLGNEASENKEELKTKLKGILREKSDAFNSENPEEDKVKLGEPGWKERYYEEKFSVNTVEERDRIRKDVVLSYTEGLCWVMHYYYEGVCSWQWFYPYHYAPFASDLKDLGQLDIKFELGSPFKPFNQLLGVFPAASSHALPQQYRKLMTDSDSPIIDFYPADFEVDMNGKRFAWQGIAKLPFIDEARLLAEVAKIEDTLTDEEVRRNSRMYDMLFVALSHPISPYIYSLDDRCKKLDEKERTQMKEQLDPGASGGMNGYISLCCGDPCPPIFRSPVEGKEDIMDNQVICAIYRLPDAHNHIARPPPGVKFPKKTVTMGDLTPDPALWHEDSGRKPWENRRNNHQGAVSGRQLGDAAHRFVANSLQMKTDRNVNGDHYVRPPYATSHGPTFPSNQTNGPHGQEHSYKQPYASSSTRHPHSQHYPQLDSNRGYPAQGYYSQGSHQNGYAYQPRGPHQAIRGPTPSSAGAPYYQQGGYNNRGSYQSHGGGNYNHQSGGPPTGNPRGRDHVRPQPHGNKFSALDKGISRKPPPSGPGRHC